MLCSVAMARGKSAHSPLGDDLAGIVRGLMTTGAPPATWYDFSSGVLTRIADDGEADEVSAGEEPVIRSPVPVPAAPAGPVSPPAVSQHGGPDSWSHVLTTPADAATRASTQVDTGECRFVLIGSVRG